MSNVVLGIMNDETQAARALDDLQAAGFPTDDISVLYPDKGTLRDAGFEKATKAPEGAATGAGAGGAIGGTLGLLAGIGTLAIPGLGPFIAAGPIMAALSGAAVGATAGGVTGALVGLGLPEVEAKQYEGKVKGGSYLMSVHTDGRSAVTKAKEVMERCGAQDVSSTQEARA